MYKKSQLIFLLILHSVILYGQNIGASQIKKDANLFQGNIQDQLTLKSTAINFLLPSQIGNTGKYLTTDGSVLSWGTVITGTTWGSITGTLSNQTDLQTALNTKQNVITLGTNLQYFDGTLALRTFPTNISAFTNDVPYATSGDLGAYLPLAGGTMSGDIVQPNTPTNAFHLANKNYIDNLITGITWKNSVRVATTTNITLSGTQTIDNVSVVVGNRVLVKNQSSNVNNGIYVVSAGAWTRPSDVDAASEIETATVAVMLGTANKNTQWTCTSSITTLGVDPITFGQISGAGTYTNGTYLTLTGNVFDANLPALDTRYALTTATISGISLGNNLADLSFGYGLNSSNYNGSTARTTVVDTACGTCPVSKARLTNVLGDYQTTITPAALTKVDDTNVTLTLGGTPTTALLQATSLTLSWNGQLAVPRGGTGLDSVTAYSVLCGGITSTGAFQNVSGVGTSGQVLVSNGAAALPSWQTIAAGGVTSGQGTADQVLVNGTSGSPQTGALTFTTPQNIGTTSTPQFANLGLGTAADGTYALVTGTAKSQFNGAIRFTATGTTSDVNIGIVGTNNSGVNIGTSTLGVVFTGTTRHTFTATALGGGGTGYQILRNDGGVSSPTYQCAADANTGLGFYSNDSLFLSTNGTEKIRLGATGRVSIGAIAATAMLHIQSGTSAAGSAPIKLAKNAPVLNTTPERYALEVDSIAATGGHFYGTVADGTRYQLDQQGSWKLSTTTGINTKTTGTTTLYTIPTGKTAIITGAIVRCSAATAITVGATAGIGVATNEDDMFASTAMTNLTTTAKVYSFTLVGISVLGNAGDAIKLGIDVAATGTSQTIVVDLFGYFTN